MQSFTFSMFAVGLICSSAVAQHSDILVTKVDGGSETGIGGIDVAANTAELETRIFEGVLIAGAGGNDFARDEPGFNNPSSLNPLYNAGGDLALAGATPLATGESLEVSLRTFSFNGQVADLFYWDGAGTIDFQPATNVTPSLSASSFVALSNGNIDFHPDFEINATSGTASNGVYLMSFTQQIAGTSSSDPGYLVWLADSSITNENIAEETEEDIESGLAFTYFEDAVDHVAASIPEPSALILLLLGTVSAMVARKRPIS